jgi:hypothetical protein
MVGGGAENEEWRGSDWARPWWQSMFDQQNPGSLPARLQAEYGGPNAFQYQGKRVADLDPWQSYAANKIGGLNEDQTLGVAERLLQQTMSGQLGHVGKDWQQNSWKNEYEGDNPYLDAMIAKQKKGVTDTYKSVVAPGEAAAATMAGAFGGGAHLQQNALNQQQLLDQVSSIEANERGKNYERSANLQEGRIARTSDLWNRERDRMMGGVQGALGLNQQRLGAAQAAMGVGDLFRSIDQQQLDAMQQQWWEGKMSTAQYMEMMLSLLQRGSGAAGSRITSGPGASPWGAGAGAALAAMGLLGGGGA